MQNEILLVAEAVSSEKGLPKEAIFEAIEQALATATKKRYQESTNIEVVIDQRLENMKPSVYGKLFRMRTLRMKDSKSFRMKRIMK